MKEPRSTFRKAAQENDLKMQDGGAVTGNGGSSSPKLTDIIVAVHGIGQQRRYSTVRSVATRLASSKTLLDGGNPNRRPVAPQPLGYFHSEVGSVPVSLLDDAAFLEKTALASTGFAEVYWADIPEKVTKEGSTLEETKAWARTVVARANALWMDAGRSKSDHPPDFGLAAEVIDEIIETVYILENLLFLAKKAGLFKFDLRQVLEDYLGDVQIVAEFANYRSDIVVRFHQAMKDIYAKQCENGNQGVRLHIVAHSEGTVVSFLGLLQAMSGLQLQTPAATDDCPQLESIGQIPEWLKHVHGYMTIGSPIDKHILLWPRLWNALKPSLADTVLPAGQIKWRNYFDYGDPIGFRLETARRWLDDKKVSAFQFCGCSDCQHDIGFARYLLPGKAHNDYWNDPVVFEHFVDDVIRRSSTPAAKRPINKPIIPWLSPALPYVVSFAVLVLGVFILYKAVTHFTYFDDPLTDHFLMTAIGVGRTPSAIRWELFFNTLGISGLVAGVTLLARLPRLASGWPWKIAGAIAFVIGCVFYAGAVSGRSRTEIGSLFAGLCHDGPTLGILLLGLIVGLLGLIAAKQTNEDRSQRWIRKGMRPLILCGAFAVALVVGFQLSPRVFGLHAPLTDGERRLLTKEQGEAIDGAGFDRKELRQLFDGEPSHLKNLNSVLPLLNSRPPVWPVLLAAAGFLYLWWLAALIFDLAFVWHRYVRRCVANQRLREWGQQRLGQSGDGHNQPEQCRNPARGIGSSRLSTGTPTT
jgi:hypothetical protein